MGRWECAALDSGWWRVVARGGGIGGRTLRLVAMAVAVAVAVTVTVAVTVPMVVVVVVPGLVALWWVPTYLALQIDHLLVGQLVPQLELFLQLLHTFKMLPFVREAPGTEGLLVVLELFDEVLVHLSEYT